MGWNGLTLRVCRGENFAGKLAGCIFVVTLSFLLVSVVDADGELLDDVDLGIWHRCLVKTGLWVGSCFIALGCAIHHGGSRTRIWAFILIALHTPDGESRLIEPGERLNRLPTHPASGCDTARRRFLFLWLG